MDYRNAKFTGEAEITCEINHEEHGWIPFTCHRDDSGALFDVVTLYDAMAADSNTEAYVAPTEEEITADLARTARADRRYDLEDYVDPIVNNPLRWDALTSDQQNELKTYRQAMLDVPTQSGFPKTITWPTKPDWIKEYANG
jgi:hypothetical protein|tara:strand:+ start:233 stop:658 length:426 start_codon:yes stop_codon:yes gene_type:complete